MGSRRETQRRSREPGDSRDTGEFACDSIERWWEGQGRTLYPRATSILLLCDGGGSNSSSQYLFKEDLQRLVERLGIEIRVAHSAVLLEVQPDRAPLVPHVTRACQGVIFESVELVKELMERAGTSTGLRVTGTRTRCTRRGGRCGGRLKSWTGSGGRGRGRR